VLPGGDICGYISCRDKEPITLHTLPEIRVVFGKVCWRDPTAAGAMVVFQLVGSFGGAFCTGSLASLGE
jgi:hypothetical protein